MDYQQLKESRVIVSCAMSGAGTPKSKNPHLPTTPEEIAEDVFRVWRVGAAIVHLHMRDENNRGVMDWKRFEKTIQLIKSNPECYVIINCTSSSGPRPDGTRSTAHRLLRRTAKIFDKKINVKSTQICIEALQQSALGIQVFRPASDHDHMLQQIVICQQLYKGPKIFVW